MTSVQHGLGFQSNVDSAPRGAKFTLNPFAVLKAVRSGRANRRGKTCHPERSNGSAFFPALRRSLGRAPRWAGIAMAGLLALNCWAGGFETNKPVSAPSAQNVQTPEPHRATPSDEERGDLFMARKSYDDAVDYYYRALKKQGFSNAVVWNKMGIAYQQEGKFKSARESYQQSIRRDHDYAEAWNNLGTVYYLNQKAKKSVKYYRRALRLKPGMASFHLNLGSAYFKTKKYKLASVEYRKALVIDPNIFADRSSIGTTLEPLGASADYYFYIAKAYASLGLADEAVRYLRHAMENGFKNRKKIQEDPDFRKISKDPVFIALLKKPPVAIKQ